MDVKPACGKFCFFMKKKTGCLLMAYLLLVFQLTVVAQAFYRWITRGSVLKILEVDTMDSWVDVVPLITAFGLTFAVSITTISSMVVLLVGLHKDDTRLIKIYLIFSSIMFVVTLLLNILPEFTFFMNPVIFVHRLMLLAVNLLFLLMIFKYWINLRIKNYQLCEDA